MICPDCKIPMNPIKKYIFIVWKCPKCRIEISEEDEE